MSGFTPINQVRLTNVAYVRLSKKGKRFEIACYRNKVLNWRNKIETDLNEVLQIDNIFTNVSKGMLASAKDLVEAFGTSDHKLVCKEILDKGELQVSEQERNALLDSTFRDIASIVVDKTLHPQTSRPYTISMIQNAMKQIHFSVNTSKSAKSQALEVIRKLKDVMPIVRANILLRIITPPEYYESILRSMINNTPIETYVIKDTLSLPTGIDSAVPTSSTESETILTPPSSSPPPLPSSSSLSSSSSSSPVVPLTVSVDPELYRLMEEHISTHSNGLGRVEIIQLRTGIFPASMAVPTSSINGKKSESIITTAEQNDKNNDDNKHHNNDETAKSDKNNSKDKKGKKAKRLEKELANERDEVMSRIKGRLIIGKSAKAEATADNGSSDVVLSSDVELSTPSQETSTIIAPAAATNAVAIDSTTATQKCNTCGGSFADSSAYRTHFKSEWHRCNLSRKLKGLAMHTEEEFLALPYFDHLSNLT